MELSVSEKPSEEEIRNRLEELKHDIRREWSVYKAHHETMHDSELEDNGLDMILIYLIKRGII